MITKRRNLVFRFLPGLFLPGLLLLSGCSQDDVSDVPAGSRAIGFRAQGGMSTLKATTASTDNIQSFVVNAHYRDDVSWDNAGKYLLGNTTVYRKGGGASGDPASWTYSPQSYFPTDDGGQVEFFAYSPAISTNVKTGLKAAMEADNSAQPIVYEVPVPAADGSTTQEDLLVAYEQVGSDKYTDPDYTGTVNFQFRHALSRVLVAAASKLGSEIPITVTKLELRNLYKKGTLSLNGTGGSGSPVPPSSYVASGWNYAATVSALSGYKIFWQNDGSKGDYAYDLPAAGVSVGEYVDEFTPPGLLTGQEQGMFVLPQTTVGNVYDDGADIANEFGLYVEYTINGSSTPSETTVQFSDVNKISTNSVTFEIGRQYVLNLVFGAGKDGDTSIDLGTSITIGDIDSDSYNNPSIPVAAVTPPPPLPVWAQSNIYYNEMSDGIGDNNTGTLTFEETAQDKTYYQGVLFQWGSLIGVSASGTVNSPISVDDYLFIPDLSSGKYTKIQISNIASHSTGSGAVKDFLDALPGLSTPLSWSTTNAEAIWSGIPYATAIDISDGADRSDDRLTKASHNGDGSLYTQYKGDICRFLSDRNGLGVSGNTFAYTTWKLPTSVMFGNGGSDEYSLGAFSTLAAATSDPDGKDPIAADCSVTIVNADLFRLGSIAPIFPAPGYRDNNALYSVGLHGYYYSSSASFGTNVYAVNFHSGGVNPYLNYSRTTGYDVRCIRE
ncbi:MAG: fimbrillin family protein [Prevotella sp.]|jgi:hypothetical protein|nr:fimbrillin family protein [Prevotella sp.]